MAAFVNLSNKDTGVEDTGAPPPLDPYKAKNKDTTTLVEDKVLELSAFATACKFGMMTTRDGESGELVARCMALAAQESNGLDLFFHTNTTSGKTHDLARDPHINIAFLNSSGEWASIAATATLLTDRAAVRRYYSPALKAWIGDLGDGVHDGGPDDPRIGVIKVQARTATYALVSKGLVGRVAEMAQGVITGEAPSVHKLREISEEEVQSCRKNWSK